MNIDYPKKFSEFEIQAQLYSKLLQSGYDVRGEVKAHRCRFDLVIFDENKNAQAIIEVKNYRNLTSPNTLTKQYQKYKKFNKMLLYCCNKLQIESTLKQIQINIPTRKQKAFFTSKYRKEIK